MRPGNFLFLAVLAGLLAAVPPCAAAQEERRPDQITRLVIETLDLSDEQLARFRSTVSRHREETRRILRENASAPEKARESLKALSEKLLSEIREILTPEQWEAYRKLRERISAEFSGKRD